MGRGTYDTWPLAVLEFLIPNIITVEGHTTSHAGLYNNDTVVGSEWNICIHREGDWLEVFGKSVAATLDVGRTPRAT